MRALLLLLLVFVITVPFDQVMARDLSKAHKPPKGDPCPGYWECSSPQLCCCWKRNLNTGKTVLAYCTKNIL
jgi:hypothetical protein